MTKKILKFELSFKKLRKYIFASHIMSRIILNIQYRLCFKKVCEMGEIFDKNLGPKLNVLKNFLLRVEREVVSLRTPVLLCSQHAHSEDVHREEPRSQDKLSLQKQCSLGSDSRKVVNRCIPDISPYCSISNSTVRPVQPCDVLLLFLKINIFILMGQVKKNPLLLCFASKVYLNWIFISFFSDIRGLLRSQVYSIIFPHAFVLSRI